MANIIALVGSIFIFIASFMASATNGMFFNSAVHAGGIWYLLPVAGLTTIILASLAFADKVEIKIPAFVVGGLVLAMGTYFANESANALYVLSAMQSDMGNGFNSSFFTGKAQDLSNVSKSGFGPGFYFDIVGSMMLLVAGFTSKSKITPKISEK